MQFADDPAGYFGHDARAAHGLDPAEREALQQQALAYRLEQLLPRLSPLALLAQVQGLDSGVTLDAAPRLFYPHTVYKSFDPAWLEERDFRSMTVWANRLVTRQLSPPEGVPLPTIDAWLDWLEREYSLDISHSSGTTGRMSLVIRHADEAPMWLGRMAVLRRDWYRERGLPDDEAQLRIIWPGPRRGRSALQRAIADWLGRLADPGQLVSMYDGDLGADYELYVVGARNAHARGQSELPRPSEHVEAMLQEAERRHADREGLMSRLIDRVADSMTGHRIMLMGGPLGIHAIAAAGHARGLGGKFSPDSLAVSLGGMKGYAAPPDLEQVIARFVGSRHSMSGYGMTELGGGFLSCAAGRYHVPPWMVPFALDPAGRWAPKPRRGVQEGRAAFLDLAARANWGGLVTADHVQVDYRPCECGRTSPSIAPDIKRVEDPPDANDFLPASHAATAEFAALFRSNS